MSSCFTYVLTAALIGLAVTAALYPGLMAPDSLFQYVQARADLITNWHPPLMAYLWQWTDQVIEGPGGLYLLAMLLYFFSTLTLSFQLLSGYWRRLVLFIALLFPAPLAILMTVWKDALMLAVLMASLSLLIWHIRSPAFWKCVLGLVLLWVAAALRHNAIIAVIPFIWLYLAALPRQCNLWCRSAYTLVILGLMLTATQLIAHSLPKINPWPMVQVWDLAAMSIDTGHMLVPENAIHPDTDLATLRELFSSTSNVPLCRWVDGLGRAVYCAEPMPLRRGDGLTAEAVTAVQSAWIAAIIEHPESYLFHRLTVLCHLLDLCREPGATGFNIGHFQPSNLQGIWYDGPSAESLELQAFEAPSAAGQHLIDSLVWIKDHTPLLSPWLYALLLLYASVLAFPRWRESLADSQQEAETDPRLSRDNMRQVLQAACLSAWLMAGPLFILAPNYQIRYVIWPIVVSIISSCVLCALRSATSSPAAGATR